jgi:nicotinic acid mononucleotide adenylyltransferase
VGVGAIDVSSSQLRARLTAGQWCDPLVVTMISPDVLGYIREKGLYK